MAELQPQQDQKPKRKSRGRQKIEIKKIGKKTNRQVTLSKRKKNIFEKAKEISVLCGAEIAIITFSGNGKPYSFGHPNTDFLTDRLLNINNEGKICPNFNFPDTGVKEEEQGMINVENEANLLELNVENMRLEEIDGYMEALYELKNNVMSRINEVDSNARAAQSFSTCNQVPVGDDDQNWVNVQNEGFSRVDDQIQNDWFATCFEDINNNIKGP